MLPRHAYQSFSRRAFLLFLSRSRVRSPVQEEEGREGGRVRKKGGRKRGREGGRDAPRQPRNSILEFLCPIVSSYHALLSRII